MDTTRNGLDAEPPDAALRRLARRSRPPMIRLWWPWRSYGALAAFHVVTCGTLWATGFPRWRTGVVAACWLVQAAAALRLSARGTAPMELGTYPPGALWLGLVHLVTSAVAIALTGGLASPMFVALLMPAVTSLALFGAVRQCRTLVAVTAALAVLLGVLPDAWRGPTPLASAHALLAAASLVATVVIVGTNVLRLRRALRESAVDLSRVRDELASEALARARSLEEVGAQIAHELKNPLSAVKALAQLGAAGPGAAADRFATIDREVADMQQVLRDYLSFTRPLDELRPERVELGAVVDDVLAILATRARRAGVRQSRRGDASITADRRRLGEALLNLVANAIEATPPGGSVEVEVDEQDGQARLVVRDTGRGMSADVLARAGTPFFTTRDAGTGLGLVLARSVLQQHGGAIRLESAPGEGTTVTATLPVEAPPSGGREEPPRPPAASLRLPWITVAFTVGFNGVAIGATFLGGLPLGRVAGVAAVTLVKLLLTLRYAIRPSPPVGVGAYPPSALVLGLAHVVGGAAWMALTGGLRSPFLVTLFPPAIVTLALFDAVWQSRLVLAATAASVLLLGVLPAEVTGPPLSGGAGAVLAAAAALAAMLIVGVNLVRAREVLSASARELAQARDALASRALARARSLEEVGAKVARDLERPLAAVGRLARAGAGAAEGLAREWLEVIAREVARMQGILADYLTFARPLQSFHPEHVALGPLVADVLGVLSGRAARAGVRENCRGDASVTADPRRLKEALLNLVANAIDATPAGGEVDVQVGGDDGQARIVIRDTGGGMPAEVLDRLGTPFFTTRAAGTGLGVVLARSVFHRHGGGLRYESAPGRGTTVTATLPFQAGGRRTDGERAPGR